MKKNYILKLLFFLLIYSYQQCAARQNSPQIVDTSILQNWQSLNDGSGKISNNGLFACYSISKSIYNLYAADKQIFRSLESEWQVILDSVAGEASISEDSRLGIVMLKNNRLFIQELGKHQSEVLSDVKSFILQTVKNQQYLIYFKTGDSNEVIFRKLENGSEKRYTNILKYKFSNETFCYVTSSDSKNFSIKILDIVSGNCKNIWNGPKIPSSLLLDKNGTQISFLVDSTLFYWHRNSAKFAKILNPNIENNYEKLKVIELMRFSPSGNLIFVQMMGDSIKPIDPQINPVQVYSYQDGTFDMYAERNQPRYLGIYSIISNKIIRLEKENEHFKFLSTDENMALISKRDGAPGEYYWNRKGRGQNYVINLSNGKKIVVEKKAGITELSPSGKFLLYQEDWGGDLFCRDVHTGGILNLTKNLPLPLQDDVMEMPMTQNSRGLELYSWANNDSIVIVYDRYDIWKLDLTGKKNPINMTNGYGRKHHIVFRFFQLSQEDKIKKFDFKEIPITAFNEVNKDNGFYSMKGIGEKDPSLITMGRFVYIAPGQNVGSVIPIKAKDKNRWLVWRMSTRISPNYYWTEDFRTFREVSEIHPERNYQWYSTELINFKSKEGVNIQAILYKPDNFDSTQKYPVLFNYYEIESAKLNAYRAPGFTTDGYCFNYPMMLARGYLICLVDIHFGVGEPARNIVDAVVGAGEFLSRRTYIDSLHYGVCGGSLGGYETNCLATFSHKFSAAISISGPSNLISAYGNVPGLRDEEYENRQFRMGVSLSTDPVRYLNNSPVVNAKNVTTPILIVNSSMDLNVNVQQGIEFFISLRREGKPVWMLKYQHPSHGIGELSDQRDLYIRMNHFLDHYLKGTPAPLWMTKGVTVNETGVELKYEYDNDHKSPLPSSLLLPN